MNADRTTGVETIPRPGETILCDTHATASGREGADRTGAAARAASTGRAVTSGSIGDDAFGYVHIDIAQVSTEEGKLTLFVAIDR